MNFNYIHWYLIQLILYTYDILCYIVIPYMYSSTPQLILKYNGYLTIIFKTHIYIIFTQQSFYKIQICGPLSLLFILSVKKVHLNFKCIKLTVQQLNLYMNLLNPRDTSCLKSLTETIALIVIIIIIILY